jgi:hypothetical protein
MAMPARGCGISTRRAASRVDVSMHGVVFDIFVLALPQAEMFPGQALNTRRFAAYTGVSINNERR